MSLINIELIFFIVRLGNLILLCMDSLLCPVLFIKGFPFFNVCLHCQRNVFIKVCFLTLGSLVCSFGLFNVHVRSGIITPSALFFLLRIALVISFHTVFGSLFFCIFMKDVF